MIELMQPLLRSRVDAGPDLVLHLRSVLIEGVRGIRANLTPEVPKISLLRKQDLRDPRSVLHMILGILRSALRAAGAQTITWTPVRLIRHLDLIVPLPLSRARRRRSNEGPPLADSLGHQSPWGTSLTDPQLILHHLPSSGLINVEVPLLGSTLSRQDPSIQIC